MSKVVYNQGGYCGGELTAEAMGPIVQIGAGSGYDRGCCDLTPSQVRALIKDLELLASEAEEVK